MEFPAAMLSLLNIFMAEVNPINRKKIVTTKRINKKTTKVDLTPMVDLGFLLITFFVFTTTLSQAKAMNLVVPDNKDPLVKDLVCETCALTVVLEKNNKITYYEGTAKNPGLEETDFSPSGLRKLLVLKKKKVLEARHKDEFTLIIKPTPGATFKNLVDVIDEANICCVKRYYLLENNQILEK